VLDVCAAWVLELLVVTEWPGTDFAATSEITPETAIAPAIIHRLIRLISARPALRVLMVLGFIVVTMIGGPWKKALNRW
jgi:hypothetical protein